MKEAKTVESEESDEIDLGRSRQQEVKDVMKGTKPGKVAGVDEVSLE